MESVESGDEDWVGASTGGHCGPAPASAGDCEPEEELVAKGGGACGRGANVAAPGAAALGEAPSNDPASTHSCKKHTCTNAVEQK